MAQRTTSQVWPVTWSFHSIVPLAGRLLTTAAAELFRNSGQQAG
jgi:hypothetical protein